MRIVGLRHYLGESTEGSSEVAVEIEEKDFVFVCGYGPVGKMICEMLDKKLIPYIVVDGSPVTAIEARNKGLPVFYGMFIVVTYKIVLCTISDKAL